MSTPVIRFKSIEKVERIYQVLCVESHHGFPVVDHRSDEVRFKPLVRHLLINFSLSLFPRRTVNEREHFKASSYVIN